MDDEVERGSITLRRATRLRLPNVIIVAMVRVKDVILITYNHQVARINWLRLKIIIPS
ncbi:MAG: hypothetical protein LBV77_02800 [Candidatus Adiutrix intracellularis]|nr:hypothetical protein [Candidatus Adiutrix intracellularis]